MPHNWIWIDTPDKLEQARIDLLRATRIAVDTEYDSFRYFREKLCLLQIRAGELNYLFDPLGDLDFTFLGQIFADAGVLKILHAGDNDIRILKRDYGFAFTNLFDTSRAAALLGCRYLSLAALIRQYLGVEFEKQKKLQRSQWENRPLTEEQIRYAVRDTYFLMPLYERLYEELQAKDLMEIAQQTFAEIAQVVWQEKTLDPRGFSKIPGYADLLPEEQRRLKQLYLWRFNKAIESNRAAFMILSDEDLLSLTKAAAASPSQMIAAGRLSPAKAIRYGEEIAALFSQ